MPERVEIELLPLGKKLQVPAGTALHDLLFEHGVEFPCGGLGRCKGCKIRVLAGTLPVTPEDQHKLSPSELKAGWRLACQAYAGGDLKLDLAQWESTILTDETSFDFVPREGWGIAVDLGTTTLAAQLVDLKTGKVLAVATRLNGQAAHGSDIMTRVEFAMEGDGQRELERTIREQIGALVSELLESVKSDSKELRQIVIVGNTVMHHLFCGVSVAPLSSYPFEPLDSGLKIFSAEQLGWRIPGNPSVHFLPCLGGFVGSDILAGILATRLFSAERPSALLDLGTNGEIVVGSKSGMLCTSTAAGPAFEGARISMGMRAATGAISAVSVQDGRMRCHVVGEPPPRGICGSGLVDAVAAGLDLQLVRPNGRITTGETLPLLDPVSLTQWDIRELQLSKGAIAAGLEVLLQQLGLTKSDLEHVYLAGAFGNYINQASARRIGLLSIEGEKIVASGNTALLGAKMALFELQNHKGAYPEVVGKIRHVSLKEDPAFQEEYVEQMRFPEME